MGMSLSYHQRKYHKEGLMEISNVLQQSHLTYLSRYRQKMPFSSPILFLVLYLSCAFALPKTTSSFVLHEKRTAAPHKWTKRSRAHPGEFLPVKIGLTQSNLHLAEEYMLDVSDPRSPNFGI